MMCIDYGKMGIQSGHEHLYILVSVKADEGKIPEQISRHQKTTVILELGKSWSLC